MLRKVFFSTLNAKMLYSKQFIIIFASLLALFSPLAAMSSLDNQHEPFLSMGILGNSTKAADYFAGGDNALAIEEQANWYVIVHNGMDEAEFLAVRIKLLNSTHVIPVESLHQPSPERVIAESSHLVPKNETWIFPLNWTINESESDGDYIVIKRITINGKEIDNLDIRSLNGQNFRMLLELWRYDSDSREFTFVWSAGHETRSVWNQVWFNLKK
jgi:hypothetical protein